MDRRCFQMAQPAVQAVTLQLKLPGLSFCDDSGVSISSSHAGMNLFLKNLDITFRRDPTNHRPRINKMNSVKDTEQKHAGSYYYLDD